MKIKIITSLFVIICFISNIYSQEFNCVFTVSTPKLQQVDKRVFSTLEKSLNELMNNTRWTNHQFLEEEKIDCIMGLTITREIDQNTFEATLNIQATRPVYGSSYQTTIFSFQDKQVNFSYEQSLPLQYKPNQFTDNLTAVISFYANIILGLDYDSFSLFGGDNYYNAAQNIINGLPANLTSDAGWTSAGKNKTRYWLVENLLSPRIKPLRKAFHDYHLRCLDIMYDDVNKGKELMVKAIEQFDQVNRAYPNSIILSIIASSKASEIVEIYKNGTGVEKTKVYQIMTRVDPSNLQLYRTLR